MLSNENQKLKKQSNDNENYVAGLDSFFTSGQKRKLLNPNKRVRWSWEDISYGISLDAVGPRAYRKLYNESIPLPSVCMLR